MANTVKNARTRMKKAYSESFARHYASDRTVSCDLCGKRDYTGTALENVNFACLCPECSRRFEGIPLNLRNTMERFLIGNVC
jgi:hypothetical protein